MKSEHISIFVINTKMTGEEFLALIHGLRMYFNPKYNFYVMYILKNMKKCFI